MTAAFSTAQSYRSAISRAQTCSKKVFCSKIREQIVFSEQKIWKYRLCSLILRRSKIREPQLKIEQYD